MRARRSRRSVYWCAWAAFLLLASAAIADEQEVYESLPEVEIGKVFFSSTQRERLDLNRNRTPSKAVSSRRTVDKNAAGFWTSSRGLSKVYRSGDFIDARGAAIKPFPGTVKILRSEDAIPDGADDVEE